MIRSSALFRFIFTRKTMCIFTRNQCNRHACASLQKIFKKDKCRLRLTSTAEEIAGHASDFVQLAAKATRTKRRVMFQNFLISEEWVYDLDLEREYRRRSGDFDRERDDDLRLPPLRDRDLLGEGLRLASLSTRTRMYAVSP